MATAAEVRAGKLLSVMIRKEIHPKHQDKFKEEESSSKMLGWLTAPFNPNYARYNTTRYPDIFWAEGRKREVLSNEWRVTKTRAHEAVHMWDRKRMGQIFNLIYASPHLWALVCFLLFAVFGGLFALMFKWWAGLICLGCLFAGLGIGYIMPRKRVWFMIWAGLGAVSCLGLAIWFTRWQTFYLVGAILLMSPVLNYLGLAYGRAWAEFRGYAMSLAMNYWRHGSIQDASLDWIVKHFVSGDYYWMLPWKGYVRRKMVAYCDRIKSGDILADPIFKMVYEVILQCHIVKQPYDPKQV
jgi:hypothetical protein